MNRKNFFLSSTLLLLTLGSSAGCDYFADVVITTFDFDPPTAITGVYRGGDYVALSTNNNGSALSYKVSSLDDYYLPFGAGIDSGGMKTMTMWPEFRRTCTNGNIGQTQTGTLATIVRTQSGSAGSTVSNGLWDGPVLRLRDYASCNSGFTLSSVEYMWTVTVQDFAGNTRSHGWARIYWTP